MLIKSNFLLVNSIYLKEMFFLMMFVSNFSPEPTPHPALKLRHRPTAASVGVAVLVRLPGYEGDNVWCVGRCSKNATSIFPVKQLGLWITWVNLIGVQYINNWKVLTAMLFLAPAWLGCDFPLTNEYQFLGMAIRHEHLQKSGYDWDCHLKLHH